MSAVLIGGFNAWKQHTTLNPAPESDRYHTVRILLDIEAGSIKHDYDSTKSTNTFYLESIIYCLIQDLSSLVLLHSKRQ